MANRLYADQSPKNAKDGGKGMRNNDGRQLGSAYDSDKDVGGPVESAKLTHAPNEGAPRLPQRPGAEH